MINRNQLASIMPLAGDHVGAFLDPLNSAMLEFGIDTPARQSAFLAQAAHESSQLRALRENLNYSADRLIEIFRRHFTFADAASYARHPERIANRVYAQRLGNGNEASGDGWRFRGRGIFQITGRANYTECSRALYNDELLIESPELLEQPVGACRSAGWFWQARDLNQYADTGDFKTLTLRINGGLNGWADRFAGYERSNAAIGVA